MVKWVTFIVCIGYGPEPLLPRRIPDLQLDALLVDVQSLESEVDADGRHVVFVELVVSEPQQKAALADGAVAHYDQLEEVVVLAVSHDYIITNSKWGAL